MTQTSNETARIPTVGNVGIVKIADVPSPGPSPKTNASDNSHGSRDGLSRAMPFVSSKTLAGTVNQRFGASLPNISTQRPLSYPLILQVSAISYLTVPFFTGESASSPFPMLQRIPSSQGNLAFQKAHSASSQPFFSPSRTEASIPAAALWTAILTSSEPSGPFGPRSSSNDVWSIFSVRASCGAACARNAMMQNCCVKSSSSCPTSIPLKNATTSLPTLNTGKIVTDKNSSRYLSVDGSSAISNEPEACSSKPCQTCFTTSTTLKYPKPLTASKATSRALNNTIDNIEALPPINYGITSVGTSVCGQNDAQKAHIFDY